MTTGNGTQQGGSLNENELSPAIASSIVESLRGGTAREIERTTPTTQPWLAFATALDRLIAASPELQAEIEGRMARSARYALASADVTVPSVSDFLHGLRSSDVVPRGGTVVRAFWWGFHIQVSHQDLSAFLTTAQPVNAIIGTIGGGVPSPAAPFIAAAAGFVAGALGLLKTLDHGSGVYVSMSWFAPGIFVPTSV